MAPRKARYHALEQPLWGGQLRHALEVLEQAPQLVELRARGGIGRQEGIERGGLGRGSLSVEDREHQLEVLRAVHVRPSSGLRAARAGAALPRKAAISPSCPPGRG